VPASISGGQSVTFNGDVRNVGDAHAFVSVGSYAYVTDDTDPFSVVDVSNPLAPSIVGQLPGIFNCGSASDIFASGRYVYVVNGCSDDLKVVDISNPSSPSLAATLDLGISLGDNGPHSIFVSGRYAYIGNSGSDDLKVIDISNPASPSIVGALSLGATTWPRGVFVSGQYAYVVDAENDDLKVIDVSNVTSMSIIGSVGIGTFPSGVHVSGNYAYVSDDAGGSNNSLKVVDISNPFAPTVMATLNLNEAVQSVFVSGNYAYLAALGTALKVVNISNPLAPVIVGTSESISNARDVHIAGNYAYVVNDGLDPTQLWAFDISDPTVPTLVGSADFTFPVRTFVSAPIIARFCIDGTEGDCYNGSTTEIGIASVSALSAGALQTVNTNWTAVEGPHTLWLCADVGKVVSESIETNNCKSIDFTVGAGSACLPSQDIGLRLFDGTDTLNIAAEVGGLLSPLRIYKSSVTYGIMLTDDPTDPFATGIKIQTSTGAKFICKI